jgi:hypothetical protein
VEGEKEIIICAAVLYSNGKVFVGRAHFECFRAAHAANTYAFAKGYEKEMAQEVEQGFVTSQRRFIDREEALKLATNAGQIVTKHPPLYELVSEDLSPIIETSSLTPKT